MDQTSAPVPARPKKGGSFVWKITLRQTLRTIGLFFWVDLFVALLFWGGVWFCVERIAADMVDTQSTAVASRRASSATTGQFFTMETLSGSPESYRMHPVIADRLDFLSGGRSLTGGGFSDWNGWNSPAGMRYTIITPISEDAVLAVTFVPGVIWTGFAVCFGVLLSFELLCVISGLFKISRSVRGTLLPIDQLTQATHQSISARHAPPRQPELQLGSTIDTINAINENRLDTRIDIENEREELRGLAMAINSMLDRVDYAYRAQLRFVSDASHELRTPISVIQGYAGLLDRWGKGDPKALEESIAAIKQEAENMKVLVEQLLFLARSDNNSITLKMEWVDLSALAREVAKESEMIDKSHRIVFEERDPLHIIGDVQLLKQALRILMDNALKYTPENGRITLDVKEQDGMAAFSITDSGIGIATDDLPKLFERFYRADASRTRQTGGTGLGLSIAKWIVDSHSGVIDIVSREGLGTRMTIKLTIATAATVSFLASPVPDLRRFEA